MDGKLNSAINVATAALAYAISKNEDYVFEQRNRGLTAPHTESAIRGQREARDILCEYLKNA